MLEHTRTTVVIGVILAVLAGGLLSACGAPQMPRPPEHYGEFEPSPPVETSTSSHRADVTSIQQRRLWVSESDKPLSSLTVSVELSAANSDGPWRLDLADFQMEADVPPNGRLVAENEALTRQPDAMEVRRDERWVDVDSIVVEPGQTRTVRLDFDKLTPYAVVGEEWEPGAQRGGWNANYRPVGLRLVYPTPTGATARLAIANPDTATPRWKRDHVDTRLHMLFAPSILAQSDGGTGFLFSAGYGAMHDFKAPIYLRWSADLDFGHVPTEVGQIGGDDVDANRATYVRLTAPITVGGVLKSTSFDMRLGAGWSTGIVSRDGADGLAVPHYVVGEYELVTRPIQQYPFRTHDFAGNLGLYTRVSYQLGNLAARDEPSGVLFTLGVALHPEL